MNLFEDLDRHTRTGLESVISDYIGYDPIRIQQPVADLTNKLLKSRTAVYTAIMEFEKTNNCELLRYIIGLFDDGEEIDDNRTIGYHESVRAMFKDCEILYKLLMINWFNIEYCELLSYRRFMVFAERYDLNAAQMLYQYVIKGYRYRTDECIIYICTAVYSHLGKKDLTTFLRGLPSEDKKRFMKIIRESTSYPRDKFKILLDECEVCK